MTEASQLPLPESRPEISQVESPVVLPLNPKSNKKLWIIAGAAASLLCLCTIGCLAAVGVGAAGVAAFASINAERRSVEAILDAHMKAMAAKDATSAYALFSPRAQRQIPISKFQDMLEGNNYALFEGYQSLSIQYINISAVAYPDPDLPQGFVARVTGVIAFEGKFQGSFNGVLEKVQGAWELDGMYVSIPPDKIK